MASKQFRSFFFFFMCEWEEETNNKAESYFKQSHDRLLIFFHISENFNFIIKIYFQNLIFWKIFEFTYHFYFLTEEVLLITVMSIIVVSRTFISFIDFYHNMCACFAAYFN